MADAADLDRSAADGAGDDEPATRSSDAVSIRTRARRVDGLYVLSRPEGVDLQRRRVSQLRGVRDRRPGGGPLPDHCLPTRCQRPGPELGPADPQGRDSGRSSTPNLFPRTTCTSRSIVVWARRATGFFVGPCRRSTAPRITLAASAVGPARAALKYATSTPSSERQFGKPIAEHQAVAFRSPNMALRVDPAPLLTWRVRSRSIAVSGSPARRRHGRAGRLGDRDAAAPGRRCRRWRLGLPT